VIPPPPWSEHYDPSLDPASRLASGCTRPATPDATGNLKAVQKLLGHELIQTTGDIYTDWDVSSSRTACSRRCKMSDLQSFPTG
jgi:hypothetical protein